MKIKTLFFVAGPIVMVLGSIACFNPDVLTWPVAAAVGLVLGVSGGVAARIVDPV